MEQALENYGPDISRLESLCYTDSQTLKSAKLKRQAKKWKEGTYLLHMAIYLDNLSPICRITIAMRSDPVAVVKRIWDFRWTVAKLV